MKDDDDNVWNKHFFGKEASNANPINYKDVYKRQSIFSFDNDTINTEKAQGFVRVYNTLGTKRTELVTVELPQEYADFDLEVNDYRNKKVDYSICLLYTSRCV